MECRKKRQHPEQLDFDILLPKHAFCMHEHLCKAPICQCRCTQVLGCQHCCREADECCLPGHACFYPAQSALTLRNHIHGCSDPAHRALTLYTDISTNAVEDDLNEGSWTQFARHAEEQRSKDSEVTHETNGDCFNIAASKHLPIGDSQFCTLQTSLSTISQRASALEAPISEECHKGKKLRYLTNSCEEIVEAKCCNKQLSIEPSHDLAQDVECTLQTSLLTMGQSVSALEAPILEKCHEGKVINPVERIALGTECLPYPPEGIVQTECLKFSSKQQLNIGDDQNVTGNAMCTSPSSLLTISQNESAIAEAQECHGGKTPDSVDGKAERLQVCNEFSPSSCEGIFQGAYYPRIETIIRCKETKPVVLDSEDLSNKGSEAGRVSYYTSEFPSSFENETEQSFVEAAVPRYVLSSGRLSMEEEAELGIRVPTIDQEFEEYFAGLMI